MTDAQVARPHSTARSAGRRTGRLSTRIRANWQLYLILAVPIAFFIIFHYLPMYGAQIAFREFIAVKGIWGSPWVGVDQFLKFFRSYQFARVVGNTVGIAVYTLVAGFPVPIILALLINNSEAPRFKKTAQMVTYAPHFISTVVMVGLIIQFLSPRFGAVNAVIKALGFAPILFIGEPGLFKSVFVWSGIWQEAGWGTIIFLAALASIDPTLHEAAIVDGASKLQRTWHIDLPGILPTAVVLLILRMGQLMHVSFEKVILMQNPLNLQASEVIQTYVYKIGIESNLPAYSYSAAIGLFNSVINFALIVMVNETAKRLGGTSLW